MGTVEKFVTGDVTVILTIKDEENNPISEPIPLREDGRRVEEDEEPY